MQSVIDLIEGLELPQGVGIPKTPIYSVHWKYMRPFAPLCRQREPKDIFGDHIVFSPFMCVYSWLTEIQKVAKINSFFLFDFQIEAMHCLIKNLKKLFQK